MELYIGMTRSALRELAAELLDECDTSGRETIDISRELDSENGRLTVVFTDENIEDAAMRAPCVGLWEMDKDDG